VLKPPLRPLLLGHRGARPARHSWISGNDQDVPSENTFAAFDYALAQGCDGFEFDVRHTRDRCNVVCHDPQLGGFTVAEVDLSALRGTDALAVPCLEDVLARYSARAYLDIELKESGNEESVAKALHQYRPKAGFVVSSFKRDVLLHLHKYDPSLPLGYICDDKHRMNDWSDLPIAVVLPHFKLVSADLIESIHKGNVGVMTWTVNWETDMLRLASWGIDGLISDDPKLLKITLA
jgi:glycerophosphoryl diester phosphodiesterase